MSRTRVGVKLGPFWLSHGFTTFTLVILGLFTFVVAPKDIIKLFNDHLNR